MTYNYAYYFRKDNEVCPMVRRTRTTAAVSINPRSAQNMSTRPADFTKNKTQVSPFKVFGAVGALASIVTCLFIQLPGLDV